MGKHRRVGNSNTCKQHPALNHADIVPMPPLPPMSPTKHDSPSAAALVLLFLAQSLGLKIMAMLVLLVI